jgi:hypothetical protein
MFDPVLEYSLGNAVLGSVHAATLLACKEPLDLEGYFCIQTIPGDDRTRKLRTKFNTKILPTEWHKPRLSREVQETAIELHELDFM